MLKFAEIKNASSAIILPAVGIIVFLLLWAGAARQVNTSLGQFPGPADAFTQFVNLVDEHAQERQKAKAFYLRQDKRNAAWLKKNRPDRVRHRAYTGKATFFDQILTSLVTMFVGFALGSLIAIPLGIVAGLSASTYRAINPVVQLLKPVSPLAWLPLVTMVVSAVYVSKDPLLAKSFVTSALTVMLCSMWPTLINTSVGVSSVDKDLMNVSKVLNLNWSTQLVKIILPASLPMIFTGLRLSMGIGWMVLIAAEMLAQNPGLGKFVWDEFQNGSSNSLGRIMVAVVVIGIIGFGLDRGMLMLQRWLSWDKNAALR